MNAVARHSERNLPSEERRIAPSRHAAHVCTDAPTGPHPILRDQAETETELTAVEQEALDAWATDLLDDQTTIHADSLGGAYTKRTGHDGGVRPAPVRLGFWFWAGLFLRATWPVLVLIVALGLLWLIRAH